MLRKLLVACFVILAVSPFSAPFQTCDLLHGTGSDDVPLVDVIQPASFAPDAGSLVAPVGSARRLTLAVLGRVTLAHAVLAAVAVLPDFSSPNPRCAPTLSTILRV
jgi:hypothetical protein